MVSKPPGPESTLHLPASERLDSWKEIAVYLKRDIRTVQRWEAHEGLPVHRHQHRRQGSVYAYKSELDAWWHNHIPQITSERVTDESLGENSAPQHSVFPTGTTPTQDAGMNIGAEPKRGPEHLSAEEPHRSIRFPQRRFRTLSRAIVVVGVLAIAAWLFLRSSSSLLTASLFISGNRLIALTTDGAPAWTYVLPRAPSADKLPINPIISRGVCGDGGGDVLVAIEWGTQQSDDVDCFSDSGRLIWQFALNDKVLFGSESLGAPWRISAWNTFMVAGEQRLAVAFHHDLWWPGILVALDPHGRAIQRFANAGWITSLKPVQSPKGLRLLAGGISNSFDGAMMAVLDAAAIDGSSPESPGTIYECKSCAQDHPLAYFVFPRTEVNLASGAMVNFTVFGESDRAFMCRTRETYGSGHYGSAEVFYEFSRTLELTTAKFADRYWDIHQELEQTGLIKHNKDHCPDRFGPRLVRLWEPKAGWKDVNLH